MDDGRVAFLDFGMTKKLDHEQILLEPLPSIQDLSAGGNPFQGTEEATVTVGDSTRTVRVGFQIDEAKAEQQRQEMSSLREGEAVRGDIR